MLVHMNNPLQFTGDLFRSLHAYLCYSFTKKKAINHKDEDFSFQISVTNVEQKLVSEAHVSFSPSHVDVMIAVHTFMHLEYINKSKQN